MPERAVENDRLALRRAALLVALRDGDVVRAAHAWSRLRVGGASIAPDAASAGRAARAEIGRALRAARERRSNADAAPPDRAAAAPRLPAGAPWRWRAVVAAFVAVALAIALLPLVPVVAPAHVRSPELPSPIATALVAARVGGRGRTEVTTPLVALTTPAPTGMPAAAIASATPVPTRSPSASPSPSPSPMPTPVATHAPAAVPPGPSPALLPGPVAPGFSRLIVLVVDAATTQPIAGACIAIGVPDCSPSRPHTNALGLWWVDFPTGQMAGLQWPVRIVKDGYATLAVVVTTSGAGQQFVAPLDQTP